MNNKLHDSCPKQLIDKLLQQQNAPQINAQERQSIIDWLRRVFVDYDALQLHCHVLNDVGIVTSRTSDRLPNDIVVGILERGIDSLNTDSLYHLLSSERDLREVFEAIYEIQPSYWLDAIHDFVSDYRDTWPPMVNLSDAPSKAHSSDEGVPNASVRVLVTSANSISESLAEFSRQRMRLMQVAIGLALAVAITVGWGALKISNSLNSLPTHFAELQVRPGRGLVLNAAGVDRLQLVDLVGHPLLVPARSEDEAEVAIAQLKKAAAPELNAIITLLISDSDNKSAVIDRLRKLAAEAAERD